MRLVTQALCLFDCFVLSVFIYFKFCLLYMMADFWIILGLLVFVLQPVSALSTMPVNTCSMTTPTGACALAVKNLVYSRELLLDLLSFAVWPPMDSVLFKDVPQCLLVGLGWKKYKGKWRKRGSRGGIRKMIRRRGCRLPLPATILSNVRSLRNKHDSCLH